MNPTKILASIITIGDELLIGQTIDTNSAWMAQELNKIGVWVQRRIAVGDQWDAIWEALDQESAHSNIVLITGGLGPTADDITKPLLCKYFNGKMITDQGALDNVIEIFKKRLNRPLIDRNLKQADVPDTCTVIQNKRGTAPGMWFEKEIKHTDSSSITSSTSRCYFISMPGVPYEMKGMMHEDVIPKLQKIFKIPPILHKTILTAGLGESFLADRLIQFESTLPDLVKLAYLPNYGMVKLRLTASQSSEDLLDAAFEALKRLVQDILVVEADIPLQDVVGQLLLRLGKSIGTAESCTGGYIAHLFTATPGASNYFKGGIVSYDNLVKETILNVPASILSQEGAVSEATVQYMVKGALKQLQTDYAIAVSGIMGPDGGSPEKPVGTVWIAVGNHQAIKTQHFHFRFDRKRNMELTANNALNLARQFILETV